MQLVPLDIIVIILYVWGIIFFYLKERKSDYQFKTLAFLIGALHLLMTFIYISFTLSSPADAVLYYNLAVNAKESWLSFFAPDIGMIVFLTIPFVKFLGLSYWGVNLVFSFIGLIGIYKIFHILQAVTQKKWSNWFYLLLLPNLHFWSVGLGKDSVILFCVSAMLYNFLFKKNLLHYIIPVVLIGYIRIHILFFIFAGASVGLIFVNENVKISMKFLYIIAIAVVAYFVFPLLLERLGISDVNKVNSALDKLAVTNDSGGSSINIQDSNIVVKWISYLFRPLFYDAKSALSLLASFENIAWLMMVVVIIKNIRIKFDHFVKTPVWISIFCILVVTLPSANVIYNLGIAMRQKYMVFPFLIFAFFIVIFSKREKLLSLANKKPE